MNWNKIGHIFNPADHATEWMQSHAQCPSTLILDKVVRVFFSCRPKPVNDQYVSYTAFIDLDRKDLTKIVRVADKPVMKLGRLGSFDEHAIYPTSVVEGEIIGTWLYYAGWNRCQSVPYNCSIGLAYSDDHGENFTRYYNGPILTRDVNECYELSGPKIRYFNGKAYLFYLAGEGWVKYKDRSESIYKIRMAVSNDEQTWERMYVNIIEPKLKPECQAGPDVFFKDGLYNMYFSYRHGLDFRNAERGYRIGYAYSTDLYDWTRADEQAGIGLSETGSDSEMQHYPHVFELDGEWYMLYNGNDFGRYGLHLAKMI